MSPLVPYKKDNSGVPQNCFSADLQVQASDRGSQRELGTVKSYSSKHEYGFVASDEVQGVLGFSKSGVVCDKFSSVGLGFVVTYTIEESTKRDTRACTLDFFLKAASSGSIALTTVVLCMRKTLV